MAKRTAGVEQLVRDVLPSIRRPYSEDVIYEVCDAIKDNPHWRASYHDLVDVLSRDVVNNWIGQYVKDAVGGRRTRVASASNPDSLIRSYSKLGF
jgi:hypothetical protein